MVRAKEIKEGDWVEIKSDYESLGRIRVLNSEEGTFMADFFNEGGGVEFNGEHIPISRIVSIITDQKEIDELEKEYRSCLEYTDDDWEHVLLPDAEETHS